MSPMIIQWDFSVCTVASHLMQLHFIEINVESNQLIVPVFFRETNTNSLEVIQSS